MEFKDRIMKIPAAFRTTVLMVCICNFFSIILYWGPRASPLMKGHEFKGEYPSMGENIMLNEVKVFNEVRKSSCDSLA